MGKHFSKQEITCPIRKGAHAQLNRVGSHIYVLSLCSNNNSDRSSIVTVNVDVVFFLMGRNTKELIAKTDHPKRNHLEILSLDHCDNPIFSLHMIYVGLKWLPGRLFALLPFF